MKETFQSKAASSSDNNVSRRKILGTVSTGVVAGAAIGSVSAVEENQGDLVPCSDDHATEIEITSEIRELGDAEQEAAMREIDSDQFKILEQYIVEKHSAKRDERSVDAALVTEESGVERYSITVPYELTENLSGDDELFIHHTGLDTHPDMTNHSLNKLPVLSAYHVEFSERMITVTRFTVEDGTIRTERETDTIKETTWYQPNCGGGGCSTCVVYTGVDCAPSFSCLVTIVSRVGSNIFACVKCGGSLGLLAPYCIACAGLTYAHYYDPPSCLGCDDTEYVCVDEEVESAVC